MLIEELGTDIDSSWTFKEGDVVLVSDKINLSQSIVNRLNCVMDSLDLYYLEYGSFLRSFFGWKKIEKTFEYMKLEIENTLKQDPRVIDFNSNVYLDKDNQVRIDVTIPLSQESDLEMSLILTKDGILEV